VQVIAPQGTALLQNLLYDFNKLPIHLDELL
jgi:hypothetical protein